MECGGGARRRGYLRARRKVLGVVYSARKLETSNAHGQVLAHLGTRPRPRERLLRIAKIASVKTQLFFVGGVFSSLALAFFILYAPTAQGQPSDCRPELLEDHIRWCLDVEGNRKQRGIKKIRAGARDGNIRRMDRGFRSCLGRRKAVRKAYFACPPALRIDITRSLMGLPTIGPRPVRPAK
jgi:hypothetical protein